MGGRGPSLDDDDSQTITLVAGQRGVAKSDPKMPESAATRPDHPGQTPGQADTQQWPGELPVGTMVDHFEVLRLLGRGAMGDVYLAADRRLGRKVALKIVQPALLGDPGATDRFLTEARITAKFDHPNIVPIYAVGTHGDRPYLALAYLKGQDLRSRHRERALSVNESTRAAVAIAQALAEAHRHGILHRDLKPANVLIGRDGRLRVLDFGLAKALPPRRRRAPPEPIQLEGDTEIAPFTRDYANTSPGAGTPGYMAPEQWREEPIGPAADLWALGVMLFELCAGHRPFEADDWPTLALRVGGSEPAPALDDVAAVPPALGELVDRCLQKSPEARPSALEMVDQLSAILGSPSAEAVAAQSPFRGLLPFDERHKNVYFGREREIAAFIERAREQPVLPVVARSGAGKTSFVLAGVIPRLREQGPWTVLRVRPGSRPFMALAERLLRGDSGSKSWASESGGPIRGDHPGPGAPAHESPGSHGDGASGVDPSELSPKGRADARDRLARSLLEQPRQLSLMLRRLAESGNGKVLLFVDQLEELVTHGDDEALRHHFLEAICTAADHPSDPVRVVFAARDDYLSRLATSPAMAAALTRVTVLGALDRAAVAETLRRPVEAAGYRYEESGLVDDMVAAVEDSPSPLPLLQFAARRLWENRDKDRRLLLCAAFEQMGGVGGALGTHADGVLQELSDDEVRVARQLLLRLVTPERTRKVVSQAEALEGLDTPDVGESANSSRPPAGQRALSHLVAARLVSISRTRGDGRHGAILELAHESLIHTWSTLARWIDESREDLAFVAELSQAAELWRSRGRRPAELWQAGALREAKRSAERCSAELPQKAVDFLAASADRERRRVRGKRLSLAGVMALLGVIAVIAVLAAVLIADREKTAREQRDLAERREAVAQQRSALVLREGARAAVSAKRMLEARAKLRLALEVEREPSTTSRATWWQIQSQSLLWSQPLGGWVTSVDFSADGHLLAAASDRGPVYLLDTRTREPRLMHVHRGQVMAVAFSPDDAMLASGDLQGQLHLWDPTTGATLREIVDAGPAQRTVAFSPDGRLLASGDYTGVVRVWDVASGDRRHVLEGHEGVVVTVSFSADGERLASAGLDQTVRVWDVRSGAARSVCRGHTAGVMGVAFHPEGELLVSGSIDRTVRLWEPESCRELGRLEGHRDSVMALDFDPSGRRLATVSADHTLRVWQLATRRQEREIVAHSDAAICVRFSSDGKWVATGGGDHRVRLWALRSSSMRSSRPTHSAPVSDARWSPSGHQLVSADRAGEIRLWDLRTGEPLRTLVGHVGGVRSTVFSPDGTLIASGGFDDSVRLWRASTGQALYSRFHDSPSVRSLAFSPDGALLAAGLANGAVRLWEARTGRLAGSLIGHTGPARTVRFGQAGRRLVSGGMDGTVRLWDPVASTQLHQFPTGASDVESLDVAHDGQWLAVANEHGVKRIDIATGESRDLGLGQVRAYDVRFHPSQERLAVAQSDGSATILDMESGARISLRGHREEVNAVDWSPDGRLVATASDDTSLRLWHAEDGRPYWRAPVLFGAPPWLLTHRGWEVVGPGDETTTPDASATPPGLGPNLLQALAQRARHGATSAHRSGTEAKALMCLQTHDDVLEVWSIEEDQRRAHRSLPGLAQVVALPQACAARTKNAALIQAGDGAPLALPLEAPPNVLAAYRDRLLVAAGSTLHVFDAHGAEHSRRSCGADATALAAVERVGRSEGDTAPEEHAPETWFALGHANGALSILPAAATERTASPAPSFRWTPASAPVRMIAGPPGTLVVGYAMGAVRLWSLADGTELAHANLHGAIAHLRLHEQQLVAATDLGQYLWWDLRTFYQDDCALLREVWQQVPVISERGRFVLRPPPANHRCRGKSVP